MSTTTTRAPLGSASRRRSRNRSGTDAPTPAERAGARLAGLALLAMVALSLPAAALLDGAAPGGPHTVAGTAFVAIAVVDVVVGWGLYVLLRGRAHPPAYATLVSRAGYAVLLAASAARLLWPGGDGVEGFRVDWSQALVVFGVHLVVAGVALWRSGLAPLPVVVATGLAGAAYLLDDVLARFADVPWRGALVPLMLGELALMAWLLVVGRRRRGRPPG